MARDRGQHQKPATSRRVGIRNTYSKKLRAVGHRLRIATRRFNYRTCTYAKSSTPKKKCAAENGFARRCSISRIFLLTRSDVPVPFESVHRRARLNSEMPRFDDADLTTARLIVRWDCELRKCHLKGILRERPTASFETWGASVAEGDSVDYAVPGPRRRRPHTFLGGVEIACLLFCL